MPTIFDRLAQHGGQCPASTVHQSRLRLFQATRRPIASEQVLESSWGRVRVKGRLGQQHADVLEAILCASMRAGDLGDGRVKLLVDPARVRRLARQDGTTLKRVLDDLLQAVVEIIEPSHLAGIGHLIDHIDWAARRDGSFVTVPGRGGALPGNRRLWRVELGKALCRLVEADLWIHRDPSGLARLRHGISQAVARHVLSHRTGTCDGWSIETLLRAAAGDLSPQALRNRKQEIASDVAKLADLGVESPALREVRREAERRREQNRGKREQSRGKRDQNRGNGSKTAGFQVLQALQEPEGKDLGGPSSRSTGRWLYAGQEFAQEG